MPNYYQVDINEVLKKKGIKLYDEIVKETIKIRIILYRKRRDDELDNPNRKRKYLNRLLPQFKAYWIGYVNLTARREDILEVPEDSMKIFDYDQAKRLFIQFSVAA